MTQRQITILGALLHDIGKFQWRSDSEKYIDHESRGEGFIKTSFKNFNIFSSDRDLSRLVESSKRSSSAIKRADIHSAAGEREPDESSATRRQLVSVFSRIDIGKAPLPEGVYYYNPVSVTADDNYPEHEPGIDVSEWQPDEAEVIARHKKSYDAFIKDVALLGDISDFRAFYSSFYSIMEKWTSRVCSAGYFSVPDISLFDHSRVVAALASCYDQSNAADNEVLIIKGDVSGIQKFIFNEIQSVKSPAKTMRGRSFFVKLLSDALVAYLLDSLDLYESNVFYNSGGHFVIFAPNTQSIKDKINEIEEKVSRMLFAAFEDHLQIVFATVEVGGEKLMKNFETEFPKINYALMNEKQKKSFSILRDVMSETLPEEAINNNNVFENIGEKLPKSDFIIEIFADELSAGDDNIIRLFSDIGLYYWLVSLPDLSKALNDLQGKKVKRVKIINLKNADFENLKEFMRAKYDFPVAFTFNFPGSFLPDNKIEKRPKTFEELAQSDTSSDEDLSYPALGFLRMDVDSLGKIFSFGLSSNDKNNEKKKLYAISRAASLSREMDLFFSYEVKRIAAEFDVYLVYSGGDDLFAVASWKNAIEFAREIRKKFSEFTCNNANITLSGGIFITNPSFPISHAGVLSGDKLDEAKQSPSGKDKISAFNRVLTWSNFDDMLDIGDNIFRILEIKGNDKKSLSRSALYQLLTMTQKCIKRDGSLNIDAVARTTAKMHYLFARNHVDAKEIEEKKNGFKTELAEYFLTSDNNSREGWYKNFIVPASYVLLQTRKSKNK